MIKTFVTLPTVRFLLLILSWPLISKVCASHECVYSWTYKLGKAADASLKKSKRDERIFHIDQTPDSTSVAKFQYAQMETADAIVCIAVSSKMIVCYFTRKFSVPRDAGRAMSHVW